MFIIFYAFVNWIIANYQPPNWYLISNFCIYRCINKHKIVLKQRENVFAGKFLYSKVLLPPSNAPGTWIEKSAVLVHITLAGKTVVVIAALGTLSDFTRFLLAMVAAMSIVSPHFHFTISNRRTAYVKVLYLYWIFNFMFFCMRNFSSIDWQTANFTTFALKI